MNTKRAIQSKTIWFNVLSVVAISLAALMGSKEFMELIGGYGSILIILSNVVNVVLRLKTTEPIKLERPMQKKAKSHQKLNPLDEAIKLDDQDLKDF